MDEREALDIAEHIANGLRREAHANLVNRRLDTPEVTEMVGASGARYQIEVVAFWDDKKDGNLRVIVHIDDGGMRAFMPLTVDFIIAPDGSFIGE